MLNVTVRPIGSGRVSISTVDVAVERTETGTVTTTKDAHNYTLRDDSERLTCELACFRRLAERGRLVLREEAI